MPVATWTTSAVGAATGGLIGLTLGTLGGPLGVLLGGAWGMLLGSLVNLDAAEEEESILATMARAIQPGSTAVIAQVTDTTTEVVDAEIEHLGSVVMRRPVAEVEAELAAAKEATRAAEEEARRKLREERKAEVKGRVQQELDRQTTACGSKPASACAMA